MRGTLRKAKTNKTSSKSARGGTSELERPVKGKTKKITKKTGKIAKPSRSARRSRRDEDEDDDDDDRGGRFGPPPRQNNAGLVMMIVGILVAVVIGGAMIGGSGGPTSVDESEAAKAFMKIDGTYALCKGGDALAENRVALRTSFQRIADTYPGTEAAEKSLKRLQELK
jgi:hypothetical protein